MKTRKLPMKCAICGENHILEFPFSTDPLVAALTVRKEGWYLVKGDKKGYGCPECIEKAKTRS